jgi:hypothetical protein
MDDLYSNPFALKAALILEAAEMAGDHERAHILDTIAALSDAELDHLLRQGMAAPGPGSYERPTEPLRYAHWIDKGPVAAGDPRHRWYSPSAHRTLFQVREPGTGRGAGGGHGPPTQAPPPDPVARLAAYLKSLDAAKLTHIEAEKVTRALETFDSEQVERLRQMIGLAHDDPKAVEMVREVHGLQNA